MTKMNTSAKRIEVLGQAKASTKGQTIFDAADLGVQKRNQPPGLTVD